MQGHAIAGDQLRAHTCARTFPPAHDNSLQPVVEQPNNHLRNRATSLARFFLCAIIAPLNAMSSPANLLKTLKKAAAGLTLAELLAPHPKLARRTAQRWLSQRVDEGQLVALGSGRARCYRVICSVPETAPAAGGFPNSSRFHPIAETFSPTSINRSKCASRSVISAISSTRINPIARGIWRSRCAASCERWERRRPRSGRL